jgi:hypothetical protein
MIRKFLSVILLTFMLPFISTKSECLPDAGVWGPRLCPDGLDPEVNSTVENSYNDYLPEYEFVVCGVFKDESHILNEWINHYLNRGVSHIYLVNDNSNDNYMEIIDKFSTKVTLFHNDIYTQNVGRQTLIYDKYFKPIIQKSKWVAILDLDEFLYSPNEMELIKIINKYDNYSQIKVDWLHFGSNEHLFQPQSVIEGFTKRSLIDTTKPYYSYKCIFKSQFLIKFEVHQNNVIGDTIHLKYLEENPSELIINHYTIQSLDFFMKLKHTRGDINNWFQSQGLERNYSYFKNYDINDVEDYRLYEQSKHYLDNIKLDKVNKDGVTLIITSHNRPQLLFKTLETFVKYNTYPIIETFIIDDSGIIDCNKDVFNNFKNILNIKIIYNNNNIGQTKSIDKVYSYVTTKYIFHCEDDWEFLQPNFIEKSLNIFHNNQDEKIFTVWLRPHDETSGHPIIRDTLNRGYFEMTKDFSYYDKGIKYIWHGITFNPGLRKTSVCLEHHPYHLKCKNNKEHVGEYKINKKYGEYNYYSVILDDEKGHVKHIGYGHHIVTILD